MLHTYVRVKKSYFELDRAHIDALENLSKNDRVGSGTLNRANYCNLIENTKTP